MIEEAKKAKKIPDVKKLEKTLHKIEALEGEKGSGKVASKMAGKKS